MSKRWLIRWMTVSSILALTSFGTLATGGTASKVRPADCAGRWYPENPTMLGKQVDELLDQAATPRLPGKPIAIISPHAGYRFSAPVAAAGYAALRNHTYKRVIVLAISHRDANSYVGVDVPKDLTAYDTPLGKVPIDREVCDRLLEKPIFTSHPGMDRGEIGRASCRERV